MSGRRAVGLIRTRKYRPSNELRERALQTKPDASRQRRSTLGGINAATTDSSACNTQPTPEFNTADTNYQGLKTGHKLRQPDDGSSNTPTKTKAHDKRKKDSDLEPEPCPHNLANTATSLVVTEETGQRHAYPSSERRKHRTTPTPDDTQLGRRLTYVSKVKSVRRSISRLSHFGSLCSQ